MQNREDIPVVEYFFLSLFLVLSFLFISLLSMKAESNNYTLEVPCKVYDKVDKVCKKLQKVQYIIDIPESDFERPLSFYRTVECYVSYKEEPLIYFKVPCYKDKDKVMVSLDSLYIYRTVIIKRYPKLSDIIHWNLEIYVSNSFLDIQEIVIKKLEIKPAFTEETEII